MKQAITAYIPYVDSDPRPGQLTDEHPQATGQVVLLLDEAPDLVIRACDLMSTTLIEIPYDLPDEIWFKIRNADFTIIEALPF